MGALFWRMRARRSVRSLSRSQLVDSQPDTLTGAADDNFEEDKQDAEDFPEDAARWTGEKVGLSHSLVHILLSEIPC